MSRRGRAIGFASAAAICAGLAAGAGGGAAADPQASYGELRDVVAATQTIPAGRALGRDAVAEALVVRRVPESFLPPDALSSPAEALGRRPVTDIPAGGYLLASQFRAPAQDTRATPPALRGGRTPVEIGVQGAAPLAGARGRRVDVVVTTESGPTGGAGRTFVAARRVVLLDLRAGTADPTGAPVPSASGDTWIATLALSRVQALRLIHAQSFAREVRLIGR
jgi:Flp pilus assembly protein CpaB